eukprot:Hpha_TRINITY_DN24036_c0_g1::TRINITY_DN24036_c0_g1_i1::g.130424::m.130424
MWRVAVACLLICSVARCHEDTWVRHPNNNCYTGHGARDLETPTGSSCGTMSVSECKARCDALPGCTGITVLQGSGDVPCYRRADIHLTQCAGGDYDTWTNSPPEPPIPGLEDVCANLTQAEKCSPEICEMKPNATVQLES